MTDNKPTPVPKFGSFKPKKKDPAQSNASQPDLTKTNGKQHEVGKHRVEKPKKKIKIRKRSPLPKSPEELRQAGQDRATRRRDFNANRENWHLGNQVRGEPLPKQKLDCCFIDTKGDLENMRYGKSSTWTVPLYRLAGDGSILGLDPAIKFEKIRDDPHGYVLVYPRKKRPAPVQVIEPVEDEQFEDQAVNDGTDGLEAEAFEGDEVRMAESEFIAFPLREKQDRAPSMPIVTPKG